MRYVLFWTLMLLLLWTAQDMARADDHSFRMGMGIINGERTGEVKTFSVRREEHQVYGVYSAYEGGLWTDTGRAAGRKASGFGLGQIGIKPGSEEGLFGAAFLGLGGISQTDSQLGGHFQFVENIGVGIRDGAGFVSIDYRHFSSAGLSKPNKGRDFLVFSIGVSL